MRVIRRKGQFGTQIEVVGRGREPDPVALARNLERPIGRGGGMRDPLPGKPRERPNRDRYVTVSVKRHVSGWIDRQCEDRGLSRAAFLGMLVEGARMMSPDDLDEMIAGFIETDHG